MSDSSRDLFSVLAHSLLCNLYVGVTSCAVNWTEMLVPHKSLAVGLYMHATAQSPYNEIFTVTYCIFIVISFCTFLKTNTNFM